MTLMRYEPFNLLNQLQREVNRLFDTNRFGDEETGHALADWAPAVDIKEEANQFIIHADLPGVEVKDIDISLENGVLTLKGQRSIEQKEETDKYRRVERGARFVPAAVLAAGCGGCRESLRQMPGWRTGIAGAETGSSATSPDRD
jgi:HSP20 family molecular chaperone IbpA